MSIGSTSCVWRSCRDRPGSARRPCSPAGIRWRRTGAWRQADVAAPDRLSLHRSGDYHQHFLDDLGNALEPVAPGFVEQIRMMPAPAPAPGSALPALLDGLDRLTQDCRAVPGRLRGGERSCHPP